MTVVKLLLTLFLISTLIGCNSVLPILVKKECQPKLQLALSDPTPLQLKRVNFLVITPENADEIFRDLRSQNIDAVLIGLTDTDYQNLSENLVEVRTFIIHQTEIIDAYRQYYEKDR